MIKILYRQKEQWEEICDSAYNGNWTQAAEECVEYGFFAADLVRYWENEDIHLLDGQDLAFLAEQAAEIRAENEGVK